MIDVTNLQASLDFAVRLLMLETTYSLPGLRPALGRLANAMVAALGPELQLRSRTYDLCKSVIREMQVPTSLSTSRCAAEMSGHRSWARNAV